MRASHITKETKTTLRLTYDEAKWLKEMVQNHLGEGEESERSRALRAKFWEALEHIKLY